MCGERMDYEHRDDHLCNDPEILLVTREAEKKNNVLMPQEDFDSTNKNEISFLPKRSHYDSWR